MAAETVAGMLRGGVVRRASAGELRETERGHWVVGGGEVEVEDEGVERLRIELVVRGAGVGICEQRKNVQSIV